MEKTNDIDVFSVDLVDAVVNLIKKYNLGPLGLIDEPELDKILAGKTPQESAKIIEQLPFNQIKRIIKDLTQQKYPVESLEAVLRKQLNLNEETARKLSEDIKKEVLIFIEPELLKKTEKKESSPEEFFEESPESKDSSKDIYREPIE